MNHLFILFFILLFSKVLHAQEDPYFATAEVAIKKSTVPFERAKIATIRYMSQTELLGEIDLGVINQQYDVSSEEEFFEIRKKVLQREVSETLSQNLEIHTPSFPGRDAPPLAEIAIPDLAFTYKEIKVDDLPSDKTRLIPNMRLIANILMITDSRTSVLKNINIHPLACIIPTDTSVNTLRCFFPIFKRISDGQLIPNKDYVKKISFTEIVESAIEHFPDLMNPIQRESAVGEIPAQQAEEDLQRETVPQQTNYTFERIKTFENRRDEDVFNTQPKNSENYCLFDISKSAYQKSTEIAMNARENYGCTSMGALKSSETSVELGTGAIIRDGGDSLYTPLANVIQSRPARITIFTDGGFKEIYSDANNYVSPDKYLSAIVPDGTTIDVYLINSDYQQAYQSFLESHDFDAAMAAKLVNQRGFFINSLVNSGTGQGTIYAVNQ